MPKTAPSPSPDPKKSGSSAASRYRKNEQNVLAHFRGYSSDSLPPHGANLWGVSRSGWEENLVYHLPGNKASAGKACYPIDFTACSMASAICSKDITEVQNGGIAYRAGEGVRRVTQKSAIANHARR
jgi:hypothetical protein